MSTYEDLEQLKGMSMKSLKWFWTHKTGTKAKNSRDGEKHRQ